MLNWSNISSKIKYLSINDKKLLTNDNKYAILQSLQQGYSNTFLKFLGGTL